MKWYKKYLPYYNLSSDRIPEEIFNEVSQLLKDKQNNQPVISIIIIAHNEEMRILTCLWSLCNNECKLPVEFLVINNLSCDNTENVLKKLHVNYINEEKKGPGHARQCGLDHAKGKYYFCIDADTIYPPNYINTHLKYLKRPNIVGTYGLWSFIPNKQYSGIKLKLYELLRDLFLTCQSINRSELCVRGMNFAFKTEIAKKYGFRKDIKRGEDGYLALQLKSEGELQFIRSKRNRVITSNHTLSIDGSLYKSIMKRATNAMKNINHIFTTTKDYNDDDTNLL